MKAYCRTTLILVFFMCIVLVIYLFIYCLYYYGLNPRGAICTICGIRAHDGVQHDDRVFRVLFVVGVGDKVCVFGTHTSVQCIRQAHKNLQRDYLGERPTN